VFEDFRCGPYKVMWLIGKYFSPEPDGLCEMKGSCDGEGHYLVMRDDQRTVVDQQVYTKGGDLQRLQVPPPPLQRLTENEDD